MTSPRDTLKANVRPMRALRQKPSTLFWVIILLSLIAVLGVHTTRFSTKTKTPQDDYVHKSATGPPPERRNPLKLLYKHEEEPDALDPVTEQSETSFSESVEERSVLEKEEASPLQPNAPGQTSVQRLDEDPSEETQIGTERRKSSSEDETEEEEREEIALPPISDLLNKTAGFKGVEVRDGGISDAPECSDGKRALDDAGKACYDLKKAMRASSVYYINEPYTQYMACTIPKNGCSYHLALMNRISGVPNYESMNSIHDKPRKAEMSLFERDTASIARLLANESLPKYIVVRNPLRRTLSAYLDKVYRYLDPDKRTAEVFHQWLYKEFPKGSTPPSDGKGLNPHWRPQSTFCGFKRRDISTYFSIFRVEEPAEYVEFLYKIVPEKFLKDGWRGKDNLSFREHVLGPRKRTGNTGARFNDFVNNLEVFDHLATVLREDIEILGYEDEVAEMRESLVKKLEEA